MRHRALIVMIFISFLFKAGSIVFAGENTVDPRETEIDRAIGGMAEGSRPLPSQSDAGKNQAHQVSGSKLSPSMDTRSTASAKASGAAAPASIPQEPVMTTPPPADAIVPIVEPTVQEPAVSEPVAQEPEGGGSIVNVDANVDLSSDTPAVDANLAVDTNADTLLDANTSATTDVVSTDTAVTESGTVAGEDLSAAVNEAPLDATLDTEVVATDIPADSEAAAGLEADVEPVTADSDVASTDPADGLGL